MGLTRIARSFDPEVYSRMNELCALYQRRWGKPVDFIGCPNILSQEKIVRILERIVDTGESIVVGYEKLRNEEHCFLSKDLET